MILDNGPLKINQKVNSFFTISTNIYSSFMKTAFIIATILPIYRTSPPSQPHQQISYHVRGNQLVCVYKVLTSNYTCSSPQSNKNLHEMSLLLALTKWEGHLIIYHCTSIHNIFRVCAQQKVPGKSFRIFYHLFVGKTIYALQIFHFVLLNFSLMNALVYVEIDKGIHQGKN